MCKVLNARQVGKRPAPDRIYVGRPSKWGNPRFCGLRVSCLRNCHRCQAHMTTCDSREEARQSEWEAIINQAERVSPPGL